MSSSLIRATSSVIPELTSDPSSPSPQQAWVLVTQSGHGVVGGGKLRSFLGLGFTYVSAGSGGTISYSYQFSYRTNEGTTKRVMIS
jgi:hypothetical protein